MGVIDTAYNLGVSLYNSIFSTGSITGCGGDDAVATASDNITLTESEITAIISGINASQNACDLHEIDNEAFLSETAEYLVNTKVYANADIRTGLANLSASQREYLIAQLATELAGTNAPITDLTSNSNYTAACSARIKLLAPDYPGPMRLSLTRATLLTKITEAAAQPAGSASGSLTCAYEPVLACLNSEQTVLDQILHNFAAYYEICSLSEDSGRQGATINGIELIGNHDFLFTGTTIPEGLTVSFGNGITVTNPRLVNGLLVVNISIAASASTSPRTVTVSLDGREIGSLANAFEVRAGRRSGGGSRTPAPVSTGGGSTPAPTPTPAPAPAPAQPGGNPFEL